MTAKTFSAPKAYFVVREIGTDKEVRRIDVTQKSESSRERVEMGLLRNMDTDNFYIDFEER